MPPRFYAPGLAGLDVPVELPDEEAGHLARVLRLGPGDAVLVFDGRGVEYLARVEQVTSRRVIVGLSGFPNAILGSFGVFRG